MAAVGFVLPEVDEDTQVKETLKVNNSNGYFIQHGNSFALTDSLNTKVHEKLPTGVYSVNFHPMMGYSLTQKTEVKKLPPKLYGTIGQRAKRILQTYHDRAQKSLQTGCLLSGNKGSGKTLLAMKLIEDCKLPVVLIDAPYHDRMFMELITAGGPKMVFVDEFEKVYREKDHQAALLSMLDGQYSTCNLFVATVNDNGAVHDAMKNRPSRFYYHYQYSSLDRAFIEEYCNDKLKNATEERIQGIRAVVNGIFEFNFDMLQTLVEEMNRYGEGPEECLRHLNITQPDRGFSFNVRVFKLDGDKKEEVPLKTQVVKNHTLDPFRMQEMYIHFAKTIGKGENKMQWVEVSGNEYKGTENDGTLVFMHEHGFRVELVSEFVKNKQWAI